MSDWRHLSPGQWREDLDSLVDRLETEHRDPFHTTSPDALRRAVRHLRSRLPHLADHQIVVELARLTAHIGDGHTVLRLTEVAGFGRYPVACYRCADGLFVWSLADGSAHRARRLIAIDGVPADDAVAMLRPLISRDNDMGIVATAPELLRLPDVLHAAGIARSPDSARFTVEHPDGRQEDLRLEPAAEGPANLFEALERRSDPVPRWLRDRNRNWFEALPEQRALYLALNLIRDGEVESLDTLYDRVFASIEHDAIDRLVIDLRHNSGGNNTLNRALIHHLVRCDRIDQWGRLYAIIGRRTFSAAMNLAVDLERHTRVLFVGEPTGSSPNHYGETTISTLPHSGLAVSISSLWWQTSDPNDDRPWIPPDIPASITARDLDEGRDPVLDAALRHQANGGVFLEYPDRLFASIQTNRFQSPIAET